MKTIDTVEAGGTHNEEEEAIDSGDDTVEDEMVERSKAFLTDMNPTESAARTNSRRSSKIRGGSSGSGETVRGPMTKATKLSARSPQQ